MKRHHASSGLLVPIDGNVYEVIQRNGLLGSSAYTTSMVSLSESSALDWTDCPLVEMIPGKVSGVALLKGTRLPADTVLNNYEAGSPVEEISDNFDVPEDTIRELLTYAVQKQKQPLP